MAARAQEKDFRADPQRPWIEAADRLLDGGDLEGALDAYRSLTQTHGEDALLWLRIGFLELQRGDTRPALEAAARAHELDPDELDTIVLLAQAQAFSGDPNLGIDTLQEGLRRFPKNVPLMEAMATLNVGLRRYPAAAGLLRELARNEPEEPRYRVDLGRILLTAGEADEAIAEFEKARDLGADAALCTALIGKAHLSMGRMDAAKEAFDRSIAIAPTGDAHGGLATLLYLKGERGQAIRAFRRAISFAPDDADLQYNLGNLLAQTERWEEAEAAYRESLRLDPESPTTHANLGVLLLQRLAVNEAQQHLRWAAQLDPDLPGPHLHLGRIAGARYEFAEAIVHYRRYRDRVSDPGEKQRIAGVIAQLEKRAAESKEARARGEVRLLQLVVSDEATVRELIGRVMQGEDFFVVAQQHSEVAETAGVDVGFVDPASMQDGFRSAVQALSRGEMTEPLRSARGWHVFKRVE